MGGIAIVVAAVVSYVVSACYRGIYTVRGLLVVGAIAGAGAVGFVDDWIKVRNERNLGLDKSAKMLGLLDRRDHVRRSCSSPRPSSTPSSASPGGTRSGGSSARSGGRLGGAPDPRLVERGEPHRRPRRARRRARRSSRSARSSSSASGRFAQPRTIYDLAQGLDLAVIAAAMVGACAGFLWWNAAPARIFMGDTGSLAIGTGLACLALTTNTALLLGRRSARSSSSRRCR